MESKVKTLTNNANDALASVTNENIIDFFSNRITLPLNAQKVIDALHSFLGLNLKNGIYKSLNKGEKLVGLLLDLDLAGVKQTRVKKAESKLENLSENSMKSYNEVIRALFTWLKNKIELWHELNQQKEEVKEVHVSKFQHSRVKSESKSNSALIEARRKRKAQDWSSLDFKVEASEIEGSKFPEWIGSKIDSLSSNI